MIPFQKIKQILIFACLVVLCSPPQTNAEAFCALRDPVEAIRFLYPQADSHRSIVRAIDNDVREQILQTLSFSLHFNELGKHTLYTILKKGSTIGFVHVRSELAPWGLMEVAWALAPDLSVKNFMFQRCRSAICAPNTIKELLGLLEGRSLEEIKGYLKEGGKELAPRFAETVKIENKAFVAALIRSALKTISVTGVTWKEEIEKIHREKLVTAAFDVTPNQITETSISDSALTALKKVHDGGGSLIKPGTVRAFTLRNTRDHLGFLVSGEWHDQHNTRTTHWVFDTGGRVLKTVTNPKFKEERDTDSFRELLGHDVSVSENCSTASALMAHDLYFLANFETP